jgi:SAM-dependent methyltransferase
MDVPYTAPAASLNQMRAIAGTFGDEAVAAMFLERATEQLRAASSNWLPTLVLIAAQRLYRADEFLPLYEKFLAWGDMQSKTDWQKFFSDQSLGSSNLLAQSGRLGQTEEAFRAEFKRVISHLAPLTDRPMLDIGCAGGLWAITLANNGFEVVGTDHHAGIIEAARHNAKAAGLEAKLKFFVDDVQESKLPPAHYASRVLCFGVTNGLPSEAALGKLIAHLDLVSRPGGDATGRRVILGSNRWGPSRMSAVQEILLADPGNYSGMASRLLLLESTFWLFPRHIESIKRRFPRVTNIGGTPDKIDGVRVDFLLQS